MFKGGIADKLGNRYEAKWLVLALLKVMVEKADWLIFEGLTKEFEGFEFAVSIDGKTEWHQTKRVSPSGNWTLKALDNEHFLEAIKTRFEDSVANHCSFVSQDPAKSLEALSEKAKVARDVSEFENTALSQIQKIEFAKLYEEYWICSPEIAFKWLTHTEAITIPEKTIEDQINSYSDLYLNAGYLTVFPILRDFLEGNFNQKITTDKVRSFIRSHETLELKDWSLDPTITERIKTETSDYLDTYIPFGTGGQTIVRSQVNETIEALEIPEGPDIILLTGVAGSGKSGIVRGVIEALENSNITHLAFRVDHKLHCSTPQQLGAEITGRNESPVTTLKGVSPHETSVLIVDQVDAISEGSGRDGKVKEVILKLITDAQSFKTVRILFVCRTLDLNTDSRLKQLKDAKKSLQIEVPLLDWVKDVEPLLIENDIKSEMASETQKQLLRLPVNLAVFFELGEADFSFRTRSDLFTRLLEKKQRDLTKNRNISWSIYEPLMVLAIWMSDHQRLNAPTATLDKFPNVVDILATEGMIVQSKGSVNFFHESFFDHIFARSFVTGKQSLKDLLLSTEQHLFRRTQVRQILDSLRQNDQQRYIKELKETLHCSIIRHHIKLAISQWLGSLDDPTIEEFDAIKALDSDANEFPPLIRQTYLSSVGWFDLLLKTKWIEQVLKGNNEKRQNQIFWWLSNIVGERPKEVSEFLRDWWGDDPAKANRIADWFGNIRRKNPDDELWQLCQDVVDSKPTGFFGANGRNRMMMVLNTWDDENPEITGNILKSLLNTWLDMNPGKNLFERGELKEMDTLSLGQIAKKSPLAFLEGTTTALCRCMAMVVKEGKKGKNYYYFDHRNFSGHRFGFDEFLDWYRSSLCALAKSDPKKTKAILLQLDAHLHPTFLHLHLETIAANPKNFGEQLLEHIANPEIFDAGWVGGDWKSFADAAKSAAPLLSIQNKKKIEELIADHKPEYQWAKRIAHRVKKDGNKKEWLHSRESAIHYLNRSGFEQLCILETIGTEGLTPKSQERLIQLWRKFPDFVMSDPEGSRGGVVRSPIKETAAKKMTDDQWLKAIGKYKKNTDLLSRRDFLVGSARELGGVLEGETKKDPARFLHMLRPLPKDANKTYIEHILRGAAQAGIDGLEKEIEGKRCADPTFHIVC